MTNELDKLLDQPVIFANVRQVLLMLTDRNVRVATKYLTPTLVLRITRTHKPDGRASLATYVLKVGAPNYLERHFVKDCQDAGEPFPVAKIQVKRYA